MKQDLGLSDDGWCYSLLNSCLLLEFYRSIYSHDICLSDVWLTTTLSASVTTPQGWNSKALTLTRIHCIHVAVVLCQDSFRYFYGLHQIYLLFALLIQLQTDFESTWWQMWLIFLRLMTGMWRPNLHIRSVQWASEGCSSLHTRTDRWCGRC